MTEKTESNQQIHDNLQTGLKDGELRLHNNFYPTRWKCGFAKYHFHRNFEYEILQKGQDSEITHQPNPWSKHIAKKYKKNHILIKPISIGLNKMKQHAVLFKSGKRFYINDIADYPFWIDRKFIRRGPDSWSQKKDRWIMLQVFEFCIRKAVRGDNSWENPFVWPHCMKDPYK